MENKKPRVRISWLSRSVWLVRWANGLVVKMERTKSNLIRVRSIYFSGNQQSMNASIDRLRTAAFEFKAEQRTSKYCCSGDQEYRITARVEAMQQIEKFIIEGFLTKQSAKTNNVLPMPDRIQRFVHLPGHGSISIA